MTVAARSLQARASSSRSARCWSSRCSSRRARCCCRSCSRWSSPTCSRRRCGASSARAIPRWAAILHRVRRHARRRSAASSSMIVPRLVAEGQALGAEWPSSAARCASEWLPAVDASSDALVGPDRAAPSPPHEAPAPRRAAAALPRRAGSDDGSLRRARRARACSSARQRDGVWQHRAGRAAAAASPARACCARASTRRVAYLHENTIEVLKIGREIVSAISRGIFMLFMTLMLGAYMILTHERILEFFRELWSPASRDSFDRFLRRLDRGLAGRRARAAPHLPRQRRPLGDRLLALRPEVLADPAPSSRR